MSRFQRNLHPYFPLHITARCNNREAFPVPITEAWEIFSDYLHLLRWQFDVRILSFVLMPNHFHLLCQDPNLNLPSGMSYFMRETSLEMGRQSGRINRIWGAPYHSSILSNERYLLHAYKYNYRNPVAARLCQNVGDYQWSTLQILLGKKCGVIPLELDEPLMKNPSEVLAWLNESYRDSDAEAIKRALKYKVAKLPKDRSTKRLHFLAEPASVPSFMHRVPFC